MTNLYLLFGQEYRIIHTVYLRIDTQTGIVIIYAMETVNRIGSHFFAAATGGIGIPIFHHLTRVPTLRIADRRSYIKVFE